MLSFLMFVFTLIIDLVWGYLIVFEVLFRLFHPSYLQIQYSFMPNMLRFLAVHSFST